MTADIDPGPTPAPEGNTRWRRILGWVATAAGIVAVVVILWNQGQQLIDGQSSGFASYFIVVALVFGDAICPVLPGETTLNAACVLAAAGKLDFGLVVLSGAIGAIGGDSTLYWMSRSAHGRIHDWLSRAVDGKAGQRILTLLDDHGSAFLLFGRYVPGLRFAINVTLGGVVRMPYRRFLLWSSMSGALWSLWTCLSAYYISSALDGYPIAALIVSTFAGTALIGTCVWVQSHVPKHQSAPDDPSTVSPS
jgi:membrane-associated protein